MSRVTYALLADSGLLQCAAAHADPDPLLFERLGASAGVSEISNDLIDGAVTSLCPNEEATY
ncbi:MAG: hypothetical protein ACJ8MH_18835 [Povalibacter sp.]|jgi:hypothetical protein